LSFLQGALSLGAPLSLGRRGWQNRHESTCSFRIADAGGRALGRFCRGLTYAGFLPEAVRIVALAPPWGFKAARKIGFMPPSIPVVTGWWAFRG
jgi:hypothetical protein